MLLRAFCCVFAGWYPCGFGCDLIWVVGGFVLVSICGVVGYLWIGTKYGSMGVFLFIRIVCVFGVALSVFFSMTMADFGQGLNLFTLSS